MTMPDERTRALINARNLLLDIAVTTSSEDFNAMRQRAITVLRHYPDDGLISLIAEQSSWLQRPCSEHRISAQQAESERMPLPDTSDASAFFAAMRAVLASMPMTVAQLVNALVSAEPNSHVLFMTHYADVEESDGVRQAEIQESNWTHERGVHSGEPYDVWYPWAPAPRGDGYHDVTYESVQVVVLSDGPTNLRFVRQ